MHPKLIALGLVLFTTILNAEPLPAPKGDVMLTVSGKITEHNQSDVAAFDYEMLSSLKQNHILTETPWHDGATNFSGPLISDVLNALGAKGTQIHAAAIDGYSVTIPMAEAQKFPMIIALSVNGKPMSVREKGPLRVIYPWTDYPELQQQQFYDRAIWQLNALKIE